MRMPETFSSASAVSSAIRCWTSCSAGRETPVVARGGEDDERRRRQRDQRQQRVDRDHHRAGEGDRQQVLGDEDQPVAEEEADRLQVDRRPRHQLPGLLGVEEAELEPLQVRVEALAQVEFDRQRDLAGDQRAGPRSGRGAGSPAPTIASASGSRSGLSPSSIALTALPDQPRDQHRHPHRQPRRRPASPRAGGGRGAGSPSGGGRSASHLTIQSEVLAACAGCAIRQRRCGLGARRPCPSGHGFGPVARAGAGSGSW